jgi:multiple sugar transport system permease protein/putative spermidine/putrescine transport system permease protein
MTIAVSADTTAAPTIAWRPARRPRGGLWLTIGLYSSAALTLIAPLLITFLWSMVDPKAGWFAPDILPPSLSLHQWRAAAADRGLVTSVFRSLFISAAVVLLSSILALPTAYALAKIPFRAKRAVELFVLAPLIVPGLIVGVGVGDLFFRIGLAYTIPGVILAQTIGTLPFMIRVLAATLEAVPTDLINAARTLGASPLKVAWHILVPLAWPGFIAGGLLSFVASFEEFEKTFIVGAPLVETLTVKLWASLGGKVMIFPNAAVVTFIVLLPTVIIFFLAERAMRNDGALAAGMGKL